MTNGKDPVMAFGLKHLLFVILVAAVGLAALLNADRPPMADIIELTTFVIIVVVGYGIWTSDGQRRSFRIGFVCWSGLYYVATSWFSIAYRLPTYEILSNCRPAPPTDEGCGGTWESDTGYDNLIGTPVSSRLANACSPCCSASLAAG